MTRPCVRLENLEAWSRQGAAVELDAELELHAERCAECAAFAREVKEVRKRLSELPVRNVDRNRLDAMRFEIMAAARQQGTRPPSLRPAGKRRRAAAWLAVAAAMLLVAGFAITRLASGPVPAPVARVVLGAGAVGFRSQTGRSEVYALVRGRAEFSVQHLVDGRRFRVVAGDDALEVRGTRFVAEVREGRFRHVAVSEGRVAVTLGGGRAFDLEAGQSWTREAPPEKARAAAPAPAAASQVKKAGPAERSSRVAVSHAVSKPLAAVHRAQGRRDPDADFARARRLLEEGRGEEAARRLEAILREPTLDPGRRADVAYWAARAHALAGNTGSAEARAREAASQPGSWHADDAALLLGETLRSHGDRTAAKAWLERAARSPREGIRHRAMRLLERDDAGAGDRDRPPTPGAARR